MKTPSIIRAILIASLTLFTTIASANERVISAGSAVTEIIFALEKQDSLVAVDVTSELPSGVTLPKVGYHRRLSAEGLLALGANRLIGSDEMGPETTLNQLKTAGVEVNIVNTKPTPQGLLERIDQIATLTNAQSEAAILKDQVQLQIDALENSSLTSKPKKVLFLLIHEGRPANVAGAKTTPHAIIELAGGINPAAALESYKPLSTEAMVKMQPDVILVSGRSYNKMGGADEILKAMPLLAATPAGINKQFIQIDGHALVGGLGLKSLAEAERLRTLLN